MLAALLGKAGFEVQVTDEPDIMSSPANVLLARIGTAVPPERAAAFRARLIAHRLR
jgi:hypothetical protein